MSKTQFTFVETKKTTGLVEELAELAKDDDRSLNHYVGQILSKYIESKKETKD